MSQVRAAILKKLKAMVLKAIESNPEQVFELDRAMVDQGELDIKEVQRFCNEQDLVLEPPSETRATWRIWSAKAKRGL